MAGALLLPFGTSPQLHGDISQACVTSGGQAEEPGSLSGMACSQVKMLVLSPMEWPLCQPLWGRKEGRKPLGSGLAVMRAPWPPGWLGTF